MKRPNKNSLIGGLILSAASLWLGFLWGRQNATALAHQTGNGAGYGMSASSPGREHEVISNLVDEEFRDVSAFLSSLASSSPATLADLYNRMQKDVVTGRDVGIQFELLLACMAKIAPRSAFGMLQTGGLLSTPHGLKFLRLAANCDAIVGGELFAKVKPDSREAAALYEGLLKSSPELAQTLRPEGNPESRTAFTDADVSHAIREHGFPAAVKTMVSEAMSSQKESGASRSLSRPPSVPATMERVAALPTAEIQNLTRDYFTSADPNDWRRTMMGGGGFIRLLAEREPENTASWITSNIPEGIRPALYHDLMETWSKANPGEALKFVSDHPSTPQEQTQMLTGIISGSQGKDEELVQECWDIIKELEAKRKAR